MLKQLKKLFSSTNPATAVNASTNAVLPFLRSTHQAVELRDFMTPRLHSLIYCFAYGALEVEAQERGMNETQQLAALLPLITEFSQLDSRDTSALLNKCMAAIEEDEGHGFVLAGHHCYRAWRNADASAVKQLAEKLHHIKL